MWSKLFPLLLIPGFALCGLLVRSYRDSIEEVDAQYTTHEIEAAKESIALSLMGQLQFTAHSLIWMKTIEYLHNGVALRMPTPAEERRGFHAHDATDVAAGLGHKDGVPVALDEDMDWRGPVGELHRTIVPHMHVHSHSDPTELIPWYQLTLKLNPNLERLYTLGAFFMADFAAEPEEAFELLEAGVKANPWSFEIHAALGRLLFERYDILGIEADEAHERAASILREAVDLANYEKKRLERHNDAFDEYQEQLLHESYLFLAKAFVELGDLEAALAACGEGYRLTGHNLLRVQQRIITREMDGGR